MLPHYILDYMRTHPFVHTYDSLCTLCTYTHSLPSSFVQLRDKNTYDALRACNTIVTCRTRAYAYTYAWMISTVQVGYGQRTEWTWIVHALRVISLRTWHILVHRYIRYCLHFHYMQPFDIHKVRYVRTSTYNRPQILWDIRACSLYLHTPRT
jgi:hypothetical protein